MPTTQEFLEAILPEEGLKCAFVLPQKRHFFFPTAAELADFLLMQDGLGNTVYHACATYRTAEGRTQENALGARSLWLDIDAGSGKPYADATEAALDVVRFCKETSLPVPLFVGSGAGLHVYWSLDRMLDPAKWKALANGLKALCRASNLRAGPERTGDIASLLRPPGSHHRKAGAVIVRVGEIVGPFPVGDFAVLRAGPAQKSEVLGWPSGLTGSSSAGSSRSAAPSSLNEAVGAVYEPHFADPIADRCAQIGAMRDSKGNVPEPHWYAALGVLAFCQDGEEKAQEWSSGYPTYSAAETSQKLERARALSGATTCDRFIEIADYRVCRTCEFFGKIKSPIALGRKQWDRPEPLSLPSAPGVSSQSSSPPSSTPSLFDDLPPLPPGFSWSAKRQLMELREKANGAPGNVVISEYPIFLSSVHVGEINTGRFSYTFRQYLPKSGWHAITILGRTFHGSNGMAEMAGSGASIHDREAFKRFVVASIDQYHREKNLLTNYEQFGWKHNNTAFLCGTTLYLPTGTENVAGSEELKVRTSWLGPTKTGSLGVWRETVGELFTLKGFDPYIFILLASFAAPLMRFNSESEGGAIISLVSADSGTGKSMALEAAGSVWGLKRGTDLTEIDTGVSKAITLATLGNLPAIFDELSQRDPIFARDFVLMFTNGRDKMRGTTDGTIRHLAASWQTLLLTASNHSLVDTLNIAGGTDAPSFRVFELPAEVERKNLQHARGEVLKKALAANAGHAGHHYLRYITQADVASRLPSLVQEMTSEIWTRTGLQSHHRFWVRSIAAVAVAAKLIEMLRLLPFDTARVIDWAMKYAIDMRNVTGTITARDVVAHAIGEFLIDHINTLLVVEEPASGKTGRGPLQLPILRPQGPHLYMRHDRSTGRLYIVEQVFKTWAIKRGHLVRNTVRRLIESGIVSSVRPMTLGAGTEYVTGQAMCLDVDVNHPAVSGALRPVLENNPDDGFKQPRSQKAPIQGIRRP